jgi:hypothetical protein
VHGVTDWELVRVDMDAPAPPPDPEYEAYQRRSIANARYTCGQCGLFVSKEQAMTCLRGYPGDEIWCPPGKGCGRDPRAVAGDAVASRGG